MTRNRRTDNRIIRESTGQTADRNKTHLRENEKTDNRG